MKLSHIFIAGAALAMTACASIPDTTRVQDSAAL
jgi:starvation-inducible outer membrane lipoprotein